MDTPANLSIRRVRLESIHHDPANARKHGDRNLDAIRSSLLEFGQAEPLVASLTPERVLEFFVCDRVTKTRGGELKARVSVLKTQRVLRQALVWAQETGLVAKAPLPEDAATY